MNLDEAIKHCEEVMVENLEKTKDRNASDPIAINCFECADEHRQLAEWLRDYKRLKEQTEITWVAGTDGAKVAFWDVPIPKVLKICEILQEPTITSTEDNADQDTLMSAT